MITGYLIGGSDYYSANKTMMFPFADKPWTGVDLWENETPVWDYQRKYVTKTLTRKALNIINQHDEEKVRRVCSCDIM